MSTENQATTYRTRSNRNKFLMGSGLSALAGCFMMSAAAAQKPAEPVKEFHIAAQSLDAALKSYAFTTNKQVMFTTDIVEGKQATPVEGEMTDAEALQKLLAGSGLVFETRNTNVILVRTAAQQQAVVNQGGGTVVVEEIERGDPSIEEDTAGADAKKRDEITVTGTLIKGIAPESSPMMMFSREDVLTSGVTTTEQFIRLLPQNFGGGSSEFAPGGLPNDINSQQNTTQGTGANLRGLGSRGTLVLLNGNRMAPTSAVGDFVDLSLIPVSALQRVDVLSDGASSIYGGDAVAGVINFVLRDDFEGAETSLRYGTVTSGNMDEYRVSQTLGTAWTTGNILATYEFFDRENLTLADRPNIVSPALSSGDPIENTELFDLLPMQSRHSAILSLNQKLGDAITFNSSALYSHRSGQSTTVTTGAASGVQRTNSDSENLTLSAGADYKFARGWTGSLDGTYSQIRNDDLFELFSSSNPPTLRKSRSTLWSFDGLINGDLFDLSAGPVKAAFGGHFRQEKFSNGIVGQAASRDGERDVTAAFGEAAIPLVSELNRFAGFERVEINVSGRLDHYSDFGTTVNPKVGLLWSPLRGIKLRGSYGTSFAPPPLGRVGALDRNANVFPLTYILDIFGLTPPDPALSEASYLIAAGTAADLMPETSRTYTAGLDYTLDRGAHRLSISASYYDIAFEGRLGTTPIPGNLNLNYAPNIAYDDPTAFPDGTIVFFPSAEELGTLVSNLSNPPYLRLGATLEDVGVINNVNVVRNLASTKTRGIDAQIIYDLDTDVGHFSAGFNANYLINFIQQASETTPAVDIVNSLYNPVDLRLRGRLGFNTERLTMNTYINYTNSYRSDSTNTSQPVGSWTTVDLFLSYNIENTSPFLNDMAFSLSVSNLFNQNPPVTPAYGTYLIAGYDPANASPLKRFIAFEISKKF